MNILFALLIIVGILIAWQVKEKKAEKRRKERDMALTPVTQEELNAQSTVVQQAGVAHSHEADVSSASIEATAKPVKTFGRAPRTVQTVAVLLILEAVAGLILYPSGGAAGAVVVRALIARAAVRGAKGARTFLFVIGTLALVGGLMAMQSLDSGKGLSQFCVPLLVSGVFNLTMGFVLSTRSALGWTK